MNSKKYLLSEAERLYIYHYLMIDEIASKLNINRKTVMAWKDEYGWEQKRKAYLKSKQCFHEELYEFARKIMKDITEDIDAGEEIDPGRFHAFCRIIPLVDKVKNYEDVVSKKDAPAKKTGLTPKLIAQIEEEVLGITHDDESTEED